jgi:hypothetical protein
VAHWALVQQGLGIGAMMDEIARDTPGMVRVLDDVPPVRFPIWLVTHRELRTSRRIRVVFEALATEGYPCRVSLEDASIGEELILLPFQHQPADSPYRATGPIFVRRGAQQSQPSVGELPSYITSRLMSVRAYDAAHMMVAASVCEGKATATEIEGHFARDDVAYIHLHNAKQGCFSALVVRA